MSTMSTFIFIADYDYVAQKSDELSIQVGDSIKVSEINNDFYYGQNLRTKEYGWILGMIIMLCIYGVEVYTFIYR
jgi:hypothetical protein